MTLTDLGRPVTGVWSGYGFDRDRLRVDGLPAHVAYVHILRASQSASMPLSAVPAEPERSANSPGSRWRRLSSHLHEPEAGRLSKFPAWWQAEDLITKNIIRKLLGHIAAENIRAKRARLRVSQRVAAEKAGLAPSIWSTIETGQRRLTLDDAWRVCEALDMTLADLLDGAPDEARAALKA